MIKIVAYRIVETLVSVDVRFDYDSQTYDRTFSTNKNNIIGKTQADVKQFVLEKVEAERNAILLTTLAGLLDPMLDVDLEAL